MGFRRDLSQRFTDLARSVKSHWMGKASSEQQINQTVENERIIEAAQILLTHNLIQLVEAARLAPMFDHATFQGVLRNAASSAFREILNLYRPRKEATRKYYQWRRAIATAQRQCVFFLSQLGPVDQCEVLEECAKLALSQNSTPKDVKEEPPAEGVSKKKSKVTDSTLTAYQFLLEPLITILHQKGTLQQIGNSYLEGLVQPKSDTLSPSKPIVLQRYPLRE
jgi:hypothetical protein